MSSPELLLSGFSDEAAGEKTIAQQFSAMAALGLKYLSIRFVDLGQGIKNIVHLDDDELNHVANQLADYNLKVSSIGSPLGKVKLLDVDDNTGNRFVPFDRYLNEDVVRVCQIAERLSTKLIRGFSFYHPLGEAASDFVAQSAAQLQQMCDVCESFGLTFGLEVEANLIGHNADLLMALHQQVARPNLVLIFDGANLVTQGYNQSEILNQFRKMLPALGWIHIKDHLAVPQQSPDAYVDEDALHKFVPAGQGASGYQDILQELRGSYDAILARMTGRGVPGIFADLEPHLKGGGQFGGFSGPDGFGVAVRAFCQLCDEAQLSYPLRDFDEIYSSQML